jgi:hypothetical protein
MADDKRLTYEAPRALRLGEKLSAAGECVDPGSGDADTCWFPGNSAASEGCDFPGNSAAGRHCQEAGNSALSICGNPGSGVG